MDACRKSVHGPPARKERLPRMGVATLPSISRRLKTPARLGDVVVTVRVR
jgi:hypothetical protein